MPTIRLTQTAVERLKPPATGRVIFWDKLLPGFGLRITDKDARSWIAMYRVNGKSVMETIGPVARTPKVDAARALARASMTTAATGEHPIAAKKARERETENAAASTFRAVAERYVERYARKHTKESTWKEVERQLRVDVLPKWGDRPIAGVTRQDVRKLLEAIEDRGSPVQANRQRARLHTLFNWAVREELIGQNPVTHVDKVVAEKARDRVLSDDEIRLFWLACEAIGWPFGAMGRLLLLTAQRRDEVAGMEWDELNLGNRLWTIPRERAKNDRAHEVYLSDLAMEVIEGLPRLSPEPRYVLSTNGRSPISGYSKAKAAFDRHMLGLKAIEAAGYKVARVEIDKAGKIVVITTEGARMPLETAASQLRDEAGNETAVIEPWVFHDLRRTSATGMARMNIPPHVVDRILNHVSGTIRGVAAVYNRHAYLDERKTALEAWGHYVEALVRPIPANVVTLAERVQA